MKSIKWQEIEKEIETKGLVSGYTDDRVFLNDLNPEIKKNIEAEIEKANPGQVDDISKRGIIVIYENRKRGLLVTWLDVRGVPHSWYSGPTIYSSVEDWKKANIKECFA